MDSYEWERVDTANHRPQDAANQQAHNRFLNALQALPRLTSAASAQLKPTKS